MFSPSTEAAPLWFTGNVTLWLWFTVLFANFAEAIAEGRGRAQAATLAQMRKETIGPPHCAEVAKSRCRPRPWSRETGSSSKPGN